MTKTNEVTVVPDDFVVKAVLTLLKFSRSGDYRRFYTK